MNYTLLELNRMVRAVIENGLPSEYWVEAELTEARVSAGHCYMELVQKDENTNTPVARAAAKCWRGTWSIMQPHFERVTGQPLTKGMKVLLKVYPQFHESYGFSWIVTDIDPSFTLGDMQRRRFEIIKTLKEEGVFDLNKSLKLSPFVNRVAIVSSESAAGYGDFCNQLNANPYGLQFKTTLFTAIMQGESVEKSVIQALNSINQDIENYDCVVIIRGGGATSDLSGFDTLALAENVANFPLPVITGIGHDRDESVIDLVAHTRVKTPTAAAVFLIDNLWQTELRIDAATDRIARLTTARMERVRLRLNTIASRFPALFTLLKTRQEARLDTLYNKIANTSARFIEENRHRLTLLEQRSAAVDPALMLRRGYSITLINGCSLRNATDAKPGDVLETRLGHGTLTSKVIKTTLS